MNLKEFFKPTIWKVLISVIIPISFFLLNKLYFICLPGPCKESAFFGNPLVYILTFLVIYFVWSFIEMLVRGRK